MKRTVSFFLIAVLVLCILTGCKQPEPPVPEMTASYSAGRDKFHFVTGVWLPELGNIELLASSDFSTAFTTFAEACFDIRGDKTLYDSIAAYLENGLGQPVSKTSQSQTWNMERTVDGKDYEGQLFMIYADDDPDHPEIYINCVLGAVLNYKTYRVLLNEKSGILLPELENIQLLESSSIPNSDTRVTVGIDLPYTAQRMTGIVSSLKTSLPQSPLTDTDSIVYWEYLINADGSVHTVEEEGPQTSCKINWQVTKDTDAQDNQIIRIMYLKRYYFTTSVSGTAGGSVQMTVSGNNIASKTYRCTDDWTIVLTATPEEGYEFDGWYSGDRKVRSTSTWNYSPKGDAAITARFTPST